MLKVPRKTPLVKIERVSSGYGTQILCAFYVFLFRPFPDRNTEKDNQIFLVLAGSQTLV